MYKVEKQANPVIIDIKTGEPVALIFFSQSRERIIYLLQKADEDQIIELLNQSPTSNLKVISDFSKTKPKIGNDEIPN